MRLWILAILAFIVLYLTFLREVRNAAGVRRPSIAAGGPTIRTQKGVPRFDGPLGHFDQERGFSGFLHAHTGEVVNLNIVIPNKQFEGDKLQNQWYFVLFESCAGELQPGERPAAPKCVGTSYHFDDRADGQASIRLRFGMWVASGLFRVDAQGGPQQGLSWVHLAPL